MKPRIQKFTIEFDGTTYEYDININRWRINNACFVLAHTVPIEVKEAREKIINSLS